MRDSAVTVSERRWQALFRSWARRLSFVALPALIIGLSLVPNVQPNRLELGPRRAQIVFEPVGLNRSGRGPVQLAGAWTVASNDPRVGGVSGLAIDGDQLIALTDSAVLVRFRPPGPLRAIAQIRELPRGPGTGRLKRNRDSEAILRDPQDRGWWVTFEFKDELWLYDPTFTRALKRVRLREDWPINSGAEGLASDRDRNLLLFPEGGGTALRLDRAGKRRVALVGQTARISEALGLGLRLLLIERQPTLNGFSNRLVMAERHGGSYRVTRRIELPFGRFDNVEAMALERRAGKPARLWLMTDDGFQWPMRTLLIALDLPPELAR